jgi:hypothetical protein
LVYLCTSLAKNQTMKKTVLRYGVYSAAFILLFFVVEWLILGTPETADYNTQEIIGYAGIILSLVFVFFGIKHYRDKVGNGTISFGKAMKVGLLICLGPAIMFGLFNVIYILYIDPTFLDKYYGYMLTEMKKQVSEAEYQAEAKKLEDAKRMFASPAVQFGVMFLTVYLIGVVITVISSLILKKKNGRPVSSTTFS